MLFNPAVIYDTKLDQAWQRQRQKETKQRQIGEANGDKWETNRGWDKTRDKVETQKGKNKTYTEGQLENWKGVNSKQTGD